TLSIRQPVLAYTEMAVSVNSKHLALFTANGQIWVGSSDLQKCDCEFDTQCKQRPLQLEWCGTGAVAAYWDKLLLLVGSQKDYIHYAYDYPIRLVPELDGLRLIGQHSHELLQQVPGKRRGAHLAPAGATAQQKLANKAASFGKCFVSDMNPQPFVSMCQMLRVLNAVREPPTALPLTYA
ncbi:PREDICTED: vacuolar protein sorting-associated protein 16 homolog, partial [Priapulus caudatus]|uniref:Vacuolar protein sorting-associated protein 16 homolog n=1 Tax=Priapulus caudatus TaxID=37621 RepID=A0ABM1F717_PRICU